MHDFSVEVLRQKLESQFIGGQSPENCIINIKKLKNYWEKIKFWLKFSFFSRDVGKLVFGAEKFLILTKIGRFWYFKQDFYYQWDKTAASKGNNDFS